MLYESEVIDAVCKFLETHGCSIIQRCTETQRGIDIIAVTKDGQQHLAIEAKGETSSKNGSERYGKEFDTSQVGVHVAEAFLKAAREFGGKRLAGVAFPKNERHLKCVEKILPALKHLNIEVFWVSSDREVKIVGHWRLKDLITKKN